MNIDKKKKILAFLEKNPGASILKMDIGIPEWTLRKLMAELAEAKLVTKVHHGWRLTSGTDLLSGNLDSSIQIAERHIRNMINVPQ